MKLNEKIRRSIVDHVETIGIVPNKIRVDPTCTITVLQTEHEHKPNLI